MRKGKLLDIVVEKRMEKTLDKILERNPEYQSALKSQDEAFKKVNRLHLRHRDKKILGGAIDANNHCGAVYGRVAYTLGLNDGFKLFSELSTVCK